MGKDVERPPKNGRSGVAGGGLFSARSLSNYMRIMSSGASNVASSVRSAGASIVSSIADRHAAAAARDQVLWAGFDKLELENDDLHQVLLLGYRSGFQVWDVEHAEDVKQLASEHGGSASFLQSLKKPIASKITEDKFADSRPLVAVAAEAADGTNSDEFASPCNDNGTAGGCPEQGSDISLSTYVRFYSLRILDYVHVLKFRSAVFSIRCTPRAVVISQAIQIHCFDSATLECRYTIVTSPLISTSPGSGGKCNGPLAVGTRWLAYTGTPVGVPSTTHISPQDLNQSTSVPVPLNGGMVGHYAKESSKQLAAGLVILGDYGYKKISKLLTDSKNSTKNENTNIKTNGSLGSNIENAGTVIVRDIVSKLIIVQFKAHASPISALCFDPSGTLLVTASIHGHNINVFRIMPSKCGSSRGSDSRGDCIHLYRLHRGITNAVIQDISFSDDSNWIMIISSRATGHLFAIHPFSESSDIKFNEGNFCHRSDIASKMSSPTTLSAVGRIRSGNFDLKGAVRGVAAATGKVGPTSVAIASVFHNCNGSGPISDITLPMTKYLLVFSPSGSIVQYLLHQRSAEDSVTDMSGVNATSNLLFPVTSAGLVIEALTKWDISHKRYRKDKDDNVDVFGDNGHGEGAEIFQKGSKKGTSIYPAGTAYRAVRLTSEETNHSYISKVELHTHGAQTPFWLKSKISFQVMDANSIADNSMHCFGEVEIERNLTHTIEARSKYLIPIFDYHQMPHVQQPRPNASMVHETGPLECQKLKSLEDGCHTDRSSCSSFYSFSENPVISNVQNDINDGLPGQSSQEVDEGFVYNSADSPTTISEIKVVSSSDCLKTEVQLKPVPNTQCEFKSYFKSNVDDID